MKFFPHSLICLSLMACGGEDPVKPEVEATAPKAAASQPSEKPSVPEDPMLTPYSSFCLQLELLRALDVDGLKACAVASIRNQVILEDLEIAKERFGTVPPQDLCATVKEIGDEAALTAKSGYVLETLKRIDGKWLAQNPWWNRK